jgi:hypothetical protein
MLFAEKRPIVWLNAFLATKTLFRLANAFLLKNAFSFG